MFKRCAITFLLVSLGAGVEAAGAQTINRVALELIAGRRAEMLSSVPEAAGRQAGVVPVLAPEPEKSLKKAFFLSILLPGLGQRYLGQEQRGLLYMGVEVGIWATVASFQIQGSMREDRYREYARIVGGADPDVDDDQYYKDLSLYTSSDQFATVIRWEARALYPDDLEAQRSYYGKNIYPGSQEWSWPDGAAHDEFKRLRRRSKRAYRAAVNTLGLAVLNRLVSAIDTVTGKERRLFAGGVKPRFSIVTLPGDSSPAPYLHLTRSF